MSVECLLRVTMAKHSLEHGGLGGLGNGLLLVAFFGHSTDGSDGGLHGSRRVTNHRAAMRLYVSNDDILPCITPVCHMLLLNAEPEMRRLLGTEALMLHGASLKWIESHRHEGEEFDDQFLMDLAGNSFVGQVFAAVLLSIFVEGPLHLVAPCETGSALLNLVDSVLGAL